MNKFMIDFSTPEDNVDHFRIGEREFFLVGTAHISKESAKLVADIIDRESPDVVCVELCEPRMAALEDPDRWRKTDIFEVIKSGKSYVLLMQLALAGFQKKIAEKLDVTPGLEMRVALERAKESNATILPIDREIKTTLRRAWHTMSFFDSLKLFFSMFFGDSTNDIDAQDIETLKRSETLADLLGQFSESLPRVKEALVDERDSFMAAKLVEAPGKKIVAVVGAGHVPGMKKKLGTEIDITELSKIPPASKLLRVFTWGIPIVILLLFAWGFWQSGTETGSQMVKAWILANGLCAALGALLALAHPLTILTAFVAAPITSLNPAIAAGWVCGLTEAFLRKPQVEDFESITDDVLSLKGIWRNRVTRVLLVVVLANIGSAVGTVLGASGMLSALQ